MSLRRIFSDQRLRAGTETRLDDAAANHVLRVLRLRRGDDLVLFDGSGCDFAGEIVSVLRDEVTVRLGPGREVSAESALETVLLQGICRGPRMDVVIQKATELGATRIVPVLAGRSVVRLDREQAARKRDHWWRVAVAAAEQSGRSRIPEVAEPCLPEAAIAAAPVAATRLALDPSGTSLRDIGPPASPVVLLVGPEGGLTDDERRLATERGFRPMSLGPRILRTETAPLAALAVLQFVAGDF
jgi:16S rRNA (uracil1498-N3)-methyltransferase